MAEEAASTARGIQSRHEGGVETVSSHQRRGSWVLTHTQMLISQPRLHLAPIGQRGWSIGETLRCCCWCCKKLAREYKCDKPGDPPPPHSLGTSGCETNLSLSCHRRLPLPPALSPKNISTGFAKRLLSPLKRSRSGLHSDDSLLPKVMASSCVGTSVSKRKLGAPRLRLEILIICRIENLLMSLVWLPLSVEWC